MRIKLKRDLKDMLKYTNEEHLMMSNVELRKRAAARHIYDTMIEYHIKKETMRRRIAAAALLWHFQFTSIVHFNQEFRGT